ncbi:MAG: transcriptional regulator [Nitrososphaeria archaeon]|nr:transcriptional regulator [Nitrososphaeria archaeon]
MLVPCEVAVKTILPNIRAIIAKELSEKHHLKQTDIAKILRISQSAVSMYVRRYRGISLNLENDKEVYEKIVWLSEKIFEGSLNQMETISKVCEICRLVRSKGLLCKLHRQFIKPYDIGECSYCLGRI